MLRRVVVGIAVMSLFAGTAWGQAGAPASDPKDKPAASEPAKAAGTEGGAAAKPAADKPAADKPAPAQPGVARGGLPYYPGLRGAVGPLRVLSAGSLRPGMFALGFMGEFLKMSDLIMEGDEDTRTKGYLTAVFTPMDFLEASAALRWASNHSNMTSPELIQSQGDLLLGLKGFGPVAPGFSAGAAASLELLTGEGDVFWSGDATTLRLRGLATVDVSEFEPDVPVRIHGNLGYSLDNTSKVSDRRLRPVETFAHDVMAFDTVDFSLAVEGVIEAFNPFLEWNLRIPVATRTDSDEVCVAQERCPGNEGFGAYPHWLTFGVRGEPVNGLTLMGAVDLGLTQTVASGISAIPPYNLIFGLAYAIDPTPREVVREVAASGKPCTETPEGTVKGTVVDKVSRKPIEGAVVRFPGHPERTALSTGSDGSFLTYPFAPGPLRIEVDGRPNHKPKTFAITLKEGQAEFTFSLLTAAQKVEVEGRVHDIDDMPVPGAQVSVAGTQGALSTDPTTGRFTVRLAPGQHRIRVTANNYMARERDVTVQPGQRQVVDFLLRAQEESAVVFQENKLELKRPIHFALGKADIQPDSFVILDQVIDLIVRHDVRTLRIEGHTDNDGDDDFNMTLSQERAEAVKAYLVGQGIDPARLKAVGFGEGRPVVPNNTAAGRARNRRVEFHVTGNDGAAAPKP